MCGDEWFAKNTKIFPATELKPFGEPVTPEQMKKGRVYFALHYLDEDMFVPIVHPMVFLGWNLAGDGPGLRYFQDFDSFRAGIRYPTRTEEESSHFEAYGPDEGKHIFEYDKALELLMTCALRRREAATLDERILKDVEEPPSVDTP